jgi:uroporphyrinogen-III decarboxylase
MELIAFAKEKGAHFFRSGGLAHPFDWFSMARSLNQVLMDLYRRPDRFAAASRAIIEDMVAGAVRAADATGVRCVFMAAVRSNCTFVSPKLFEKFLYPSYKEIVERLWSKDVVTILHCDSNNDLNLKYFAELPKGSCILHTDSFTDLRKAKQILGDRMCIMGDVPATLFTLGTADQVYDYCKRLIQDVGKDGGFILSSGCEVPTNVKPENFEAFLRAGREVRPV